MKPEVIEKLVLEELADEALTFDELLVRCRGLFPSDLQNCLNQLVMADTLIHHGSRYLPSPKSGHYPPPLESEVTNEVKRRLDLLPLPHPLDYDWRFSQKSSEEVASFLASQARSSGRILLAGAPTVFCQLCNHGLQVKRVLLVDRNKHTLALLQGGEGADSSTTLAVDLLSQQPKLEEENFDCCFCDPPWYPEHYEGFLRFASLNVGIGGIVGLSLLPILTREEALLERRDLIRVADTLGLALEEIRVGNLEYSSPDFERASLRALRTDAPMLWRKGDFAIFRKIESTAEDFPTELTQKYDQGEWATFYVGKKPIKLKITSEKETGKPELVSIVEGDVLPTVSRREPSRNKVDLWFWDNRVFKVKGREHFKEALDYLSRGQGNIVPLSEGAKTALNLLSNQLDS